MNNSEIHCAIWLGTGDGVNLLNWLKGLAGSPAGGHIVLIEYEWHNKPWLAWEPFNSLLQQHNVLILARSEDQLDWAFWQEVVPQIIPYLALVTFHFGDEQNAVYKALAQRWRHRIQMLPGMFDRFDSLFLYEFRNIVTNSDALNSRSGIQDLAGLWKNKPAILVSAGPSLNDTLPLFKDIIQYFPILCVGTALRKLLAENIVPDVVIIVDPHPVIYELQIEGLAIPENIWLFAGPGVDPRIIRTFGGRVRFFYPSELLRQGLSVRFGEKGLLDGDGTVAHYMFSLALHLGAAPLLFFGQDLAYGEDGKHHWTDQIPHISEGSKSSDILLTAWDGSNVCSTVGWQWELWWFEGAVARSPARCVDVTLRGARKKGFQWMKPEEARAWCQQFVKPTPDKFSFPDLQVSDYIIKFGDLTFFRKEVLQKLHNLAGQCERIQALCLQLLGSNLNEIWQQNFSSLVASWDSLMDGIRNHSLIYVALQPFHLEAMMSLGPLGMIDSFEKANKLILMIDSFTRKILLAISKLEENREHG